ncbi:unnamed protein product [Rhizophagus irregularis]|nr:unnamed protein product [Rhizophagus irregularis]
MIKTIYNLIGFTFPGFKICPNTSNSYDDNDSLEISLHYLYQDSLNSTLFFDNGLDEILLHPYNFNMTYDLHNNPENDEFFIKDNRCRIFNSPQDNYVEQIDVGSSSLAKELLFIITLDNSSNYDYFEINFNSINTITTYQVYSADNHVTFIEIDEMVLASMQNTSFTVLELRYKSPYIRDEEERYQITVGKLISNLGGFYSAVSGIFILLFGAPKLSPWGICQTSLLCCWPIRRSFKKHLASRYVSHAGIPLAEDPREMPQASRLRTTRKRYLKLQEQYNDLEGVEILNEEDNHDDDFNDNSKKGSTSYKK